jgi:hypothetical protein
MQDAWAHAPAFLRHTLTYASPTPAKQIGHSVGLGYLIAAAPLLVLWLLLNVNANSMHQLYRDRLGSAFLARPRNTDANVFAQEGDFAISKIDTKRTPYHLLNAALNVPGSKYANRRGRKAEFFIFSKNFTGSEATGYVRTDMAEHVNDGLNIGTAMAISGAAAAPNMGVASIRPLSPTIAFLNAHSITSPSRWRTHNRRYGSSHKT